MADTALNAGEGPVLSSAPPEVLPGPTGSAEAVPAAAPSLQSVSAPPAPPPLHRARSVIRNPVVRVVSVVASTGEGGSGVSGRRPSATSTLNSGSHDSSGSRASRASRGSSGGGSSRRSSGTLTGTLTTSSGSSSTWTTGSSSATSRRSSGDSGDTSLATYSDSKSDSRSIEEERDGGRALYDLREEGEEEGQQQDDGGEGSELGKEADGKVPTSPVPPTPSCSWSGSEADWTEEKWLEMADHLDVQRRADTTAAWEGRKQKYPELFRSDVSICPSYSLFQVPYWSVCRRRYGRAMHRISRRLAEDVEELALLQTRALDGVRMVRCFSLGARPHPPPADPLTQRQRRRVEQLLADGPPGT